MACRRSLLARVLPGLLAAAAAGAASRAAAVTLTGSAGGRTECLPPSRVLLAEVEVDARTYDFAGFCTHVLAETTTRLAYTIHAQWLPAERVALEVIEVQRTGRAKGRLTLKAACPDDPWLTNASCTLVSFLDPEGKPVAAALAGPPVPKSAGRLPETTRERLRKEAEGLDARPRPVVLSPAGSAAARDQVDVVLERPKDAPREFPNLFEFRFEWENPVTKGWVAQPVRGEYAITCDGKKTFPVSLFINRGRYRLRARFAAPDRAKNPWSAWREFTIPPRP